MDATIFYCKKCDGVFQGTQGVASICPVCNEELVETDCTMSKWDSLDESGKLSLRRQQGLCHNSLCSFSYFWSSLGLWFLQGVF